MLTTTQDCRVSRDHPFCECCCYDGWNHGLGLQLKTLVNFGQLSYLSPRGSGSSEKQLVLLLLTVLLKEGPFVKEMARSAQF